jgi:hypothetical protein
VLCQFLTQDFVEYRVAVTQLYAKADIGNLSDCGSLPFFQFANYGRHSHSLNALNRRLD